jgi:uncharacterized membrane protein YkvA (DUF1232 family)
VSIMGMEQVVQIFAFILSVLILWFTFRKMRIKEWTIVFFTKAYISSFIDVWVVAKGFVEYPVRLLPNTFTTSILFDYLAFPALCLLYNYTSESSKTKWIIGQAALYAAGVTIAETWIETNTNLIHYHTWTWAHSFVALLVTFLAVRGFLALIRRLENDREAYYK